jgi:putative oxidoreductase
MQPSHRAIHLSLLAVRVAVGVIFLAHGGQKLLGLWGGSGLAATVEHMGPLGYLVSIGEFFGGLALIVGLLSRFSAFWLIVIMLGAILQVHLKNGFFADKHGFEYNLALIGLLVPPLLCGPGAYSLAALLLRSMSPRTARWLE